MYSIMTNVDFESKDIPHLKKRRPMDGNVTPIPHTLKKHNCFVCLNPTSEIHEIGIHI